MKSGELRGECPAERDFRVECEANNSSDNGPLASRGIEGLLLISGAAERERERYFVVLGFLESDAVEAVDPTLRSESARWGGWSAASMTVVCALRRKCACGRGVEGGGRGVGCCGSFNTRRGSCCQTGTVTCHDSRSRHPSIHDVHPRRR